MERPPYYQQRRYASPPSSENPSYYHQHRLPPPPPQPQPLHSPTPQFSYRPHNYPHSDYPPPRSFRHSPARDSALRSSPFYDQSSNRWSELPPPPPPPPPPPRDHQLRRPPSPVSNYVSDYGREFIFRDEGGYRDREFGTADYVDDEKYRYTSFRRDFERNSSPRFARDVELSDSKGLGRVRSYDSYSDRNDDSRRGYSRTVNEDQYMDDGLRRELVESGYNYVGRLKSKIVVQSQEFFNRSPMKQQVVQKKSALLRIGKTNNRNQNWNRSQEDSRFSRSYYNDQEPDSGLGGSLRSKLEYDFLDHEVQVDAKKEKSPVDLDVSFKSNALVAKAINPPSNHMPESDAFVGCGNRKSNKVSTTDSPRRKLNDYFVKASGSSLISDTYHEKLKEKAGGYVGCLDSAYKSSAGKVINGESITIGSVSDNDVEQLAGKRPVSDHRAHFVDEKTGGSEPRRSIVHNQDGDLITPDVVNLQGPGKQNCDANSLDKLGDLDNSSAASLSTTSQLEKVEDARHLRGNFSSGENCVTNGVPVPMEHSAIPVLSTEGNKVQHEDPSHVDKLIDKEHSRLSTDGGLVEVQNLSEILVSKDSTATFQNHNVDIVSKHPGLKQRFLAVGETRISMDSNVGPSSLREHEAHDAEIETSTLNHNGSNFDQGSCTSPGNVTDIEMVSTDVMPKEFPHYLASNVSNGNVNINDSAVSLVHDSGSAASCTADVANSSEKRTSPSCLLTHSSEQSIVDGETTLPRNSVLEKVPTPLFVDLAVHGRKRKVTDGQLDVHVNASKFARPSVDSKDNQDESFILLGRNPVSVENEVVRDNEQNISGKYIIEEEPTALNHQIEGSKTIAEFALIQTSPVVSELSPTPEVSKPSAEPLVIEQDLNETTNTVAHLGRDETICKGLSSHSEAPEENSVARDGSLTGCVAVSSSDVKSNDCHVNSLGPAGNQKPSLGNSLSMDDLAASDSQCTTNSIDGQTDSLPDGLSNMGSPDDLSNFGSNVFDTSLKMNQVSHNFHGKRKMSTGPIVAGSEVFIPVKPPPQSSKIGAQSGVVLIPAPGFISKVPTSSKWNPSKVARTIDPLLATSTSSVSNRLNSSLVKAIPGQIPSKYSAAMKVAPSSHSAKPRTWHRTLNAQPLDSEPKQQSNSIHKWMNSNQDVSKVQGSYVRRGNTLVRKSPQVNDSHNLLTSRSSVCNLSSGASPGVAGRLDIGPAKQHSTATLAGSNICSERLKTSPLVGSLRSSSCTSSNPLDLTTLPPANPVSGYCTGEKGGPYKSAQSVDTKRFLEEDIKFSDVNQCGTVSSNYLGCQSTADKRNSGAEILYMKRKSNQLVAASNTNNASLQIKELPHVYSSDGYVKSKKNQLIRTSLNKNFKHGAGKSSSLQQDSQNHVQVRSSSKRLSGKQNFSLVWTLNSPLSSRKDVSSGRLQRALPNLFPWKRASSWTNHLNSSFLNDSNAISQKLRLSRKREAIYKRSINGFSLTRSKILGVGGCNLKWSKSMEKNSRKANTEATLAVAAAENLKKAQNLASLTLYKSQNNVSRERIFRIGSERYKMDPTGRTLQRIPDEQSSSQPEKKEKKVYVPSRLLIGNDEYVRVGNGNSLVRDPKRRTRILANEKVRWSLHTARLRLARKKQYCQFFTRFGKCKDDKKCQYIHDPSKIAVCTKFLNGSCSDVNCKLTHKVIPERMQDCSYFLQGLCSNGSCPYRHVNTNLKAPVCEGFLRGYCADGDECLKKHTRVCPVFEATGSCQVPECKFHHPKKKVKLTKRRVSNLQKNARGRYFGSPHINAGHGLTRTCEPDTGKGDGNYREEFAGDYIALDFSIDDMDLIFEPRSKPVYDCEEDVEMDEDDDLTQPMRLLNKI